MKWRYKVAAGWHDAVTHGESYALVAFRRWWNPLRWVLGRVKVKHVSQQEFWNVG